MISQNRADAKRQVIADQQWKTVQEEDQQNRELIGLSKQQDGGTSPRLKTGPREALARGCGSRSAARVASERSCR